MNRAAQLLASSQWRDVPRAERSARMSALAHARWDKLDAAQRRDALATACARRRGPVPLSTRARRRQAARQLAAVSASATQGEHLCATVSSGVQGEHLERVSSIAADPVRYLVAALPGYVAQLEAYCVEVLATKHGRYAHRAARVIERLARLRRELEAAAAPPAPPA